MRWHRHPGQLPTTYTGATEIQALDELARLNGCTVKVSLDGRRTRLHAKAWIFHRRSGFGSAYVGSANLSGAALMGGLEWTLKFTERGQEALYERAKAHFDTLWLDEEFTPYTPDDGDIRAAVVEALRREGGTGVGDAPIFFDLQPKPYQRDMLEELDRERAAGRTRNLLVAATGTGKTVVAALDYRATCVRLGHRPRLLFVAHRAQILRQALRTYREVLRDHSFGELLTGGVTPAEYDHLFASIDSLTTRNLVERLGADYWHTVVIDECHRLAADRFDRLATVIRPAQLLGLTATPERSDGQSIERYFTARPDRAPAVELRLWDALDMQLLVPFEYYACDDETDFSDVPWDRPGEVERINQLVTGNEVRARMVIGEWHRLAGDPRRSKAIVFCVSVAHARFMTARLNAADLPALCVVGETPKIEQIRAPRRLASGEVCALVTVDLYNEGVDLPDVDTLLLLRPTQSPVLFQQQVGRGLRLWPGKESCLVLDFVGQHRADFRFDRLLSGISGLTRTQLLDALEHGFSTLPPGCHIHLERQTREQVLRNLRTIANQSWPRLTAEVRSYAVLRGTSSIPLGDFLEHPACAEELEELSDVLEARSRIGEHPLPGMEDAPMQLHGAYRSREILAAVGYFTAQSRPAFRAGVLPLQARHAELLLVTLDKSKGFHDRIAYHDYAVSPERFHWQTQNSAGPDTTAGRRYLESATNGWSFQLFVRVHSSDPYRACGPVRLTSRDDIRGDRPMSITWTLDVPLPPKLFAEFSVLRGQA